MINKLAALKMIWQKRFLSTRGCWSFSLNYGSAIVIHLMDSYTTFGIFQDKISDNWQSGENYLYSLWCRDPTSTVIIKVRWQPQRWLSLHGEQQTAVIGKPPPYRSGAGLFISWTSQLCVLRARASVKHQEHHPQCGRRQATSPEEYDIFWRTPPNRPDRSVIGFYLSNRSPIASNVIRPAPAAWFFVTLCWLVYILFETCVLDGIFCSFIFNYNNLSRSL